MALNNSQYNAIMRIYNERQFQNLRKMEARVEKIYRTVPEIREIESEISAQAVAAAKKMLDGDLHARQVMKETIEDLREQKAILLARAGFSPEDMEMQYTCNICKDTGYLEGKKCKCFKKEEIRLLYAQSNIEEVLNRENFSQFTFDYYDDTEVIPQLKMTVRDYMRQVYQWCRSYVEQFEAKGGNMIFTGGCGTGKTFLTNCIAYELINRYNSVIYLSAVDMFDLFSQKKFHRDEDFQEEEWCPHIYDCDLLIIDDLGTELNNTFVSSELFHCINERMLRRKSTIINTNLSLTSLRDSYSDRISSRIFSSYTIIPLYGSDIRTKKQLHS